MAWNFRLFVALLLLASKAEGQCSTGDVRLVGGRVPNMGRVEVCIDGEWGTVCDNEWDNSDARVVCRQLGYTPRGAEAHLMSYFGEGSGPIFMNSVGCNGTEEWLNDCGFTSHNDCEHDEDASVICLWRPRCTVEGDVRLMGRSTTHEGRVEVCVSEDWGTVCDHSFGPVDAGVVCYQLGFSRNNSQVVGHPGTYRLSFIVMEDVVCSGNELRLIDCQYLSNNNCWTYEYVEVSCIPNVLPGPVQQLLAVALTPQSMRVSWQLPVEENNEIINYSVNITVVGSNETLQIVTITSYVTVESLHPNYLYQCSVAARNNDGLGPPANVIKRTPPDVPSSPPLQLMVTNVGPRTVFLSWQPPLPEDQNGVIIEYIVRTVDIGNSQTTEDQTTETNSTIRRLIYSQKYNFTVAAMTIIGRGPFSDPVTIISSGRKPSAPTLYEVERISASEIRMRWKPSSQVDRISPITHYIIKFYPLIPETRDLFQFLSTNETELMIHDLNPVLKYSVSVATNSVAGLGNFSSEVSVEIFDSSFFQIFLSGDIDCEQWVRYHLETKLESLGGSLAIDVDNICRCNFTSKFILFNPPHCNADHPDWLILWGRIVGTDLSNSTNILKILETWVEAKSKLVIEGVHLTAEEYCSIFLEEGEPISCETLPEQEGKSGPVSITYIIITAVVVVLALVIVVVLCRVSVVVCKKRAKFREFRLSQANPVNTCNKSGIASSSMEVESKFDDYSYPDDIVYEPIPDPPPPLPPVRTVDLYAPNSYIFTPQHYENTIVSEHPCLATVRPSVSQPYSSSSYSQYQGLQSPLVMSVYTIPQPQDLVNVGTDFNKEEKSGVVRKAQYDDGQGEGGGKRVAGEGGGKGVEGEGGGKGVEGGVAEDGSYQELLLHTINKDDGKYASLMVKP